jgi:hypothetical protein
MRLSRSRGGNTLLRVRHTARAVAALDEIREVMDLATAEFHATAEQMRYLAACGCDEKTLRRYVRAVFAPGEADNEEAAKRIVARVAELAEAGRGAELSRGTLWGAYNGITEFISHERGRTADARVDSQWFGDGAKLLDRALQVALTFPRIDFRPPSSPAAPVVGGEPAGNPEE